MKRERRTKKTHSSKAERVNSGTLAHINAEVEKLLAECRNAYPANFTPQLQGRVARLSRELRSHVGECSINATRLEQWLSRIDQVLGGRVEIIYVQSAPGSAEGSNQSRDLSSAQSPE